MFEFTGLRTLHQDMKSQKEVRTTQNGILIAINKNIDNLDLNNIEQYQDNNVSFLINTNIAEMPDFLQVKLEINKRPLIIIGTRIRVETDKYDYNGPKLILKQKQFEALDEHLYSGEQPLVH